MFEAWLPDYYWWLPVLSNHIKWSIKQCWSIHSAFPDKSWVWEVLKSRIHWSKYAWKPVDQHGIQHNHISIECSFNFNQLYEWLSFLSKWTGCLESVTVYLTPGTGEPCITRTKFPLFPKLWEELCWKSAENWKSCSEIDPVLSLSLSHCLCLQ